MTSPLTPIFLAPHTQKDSTMSQIPGIPASLDDVPNEQTFDAILLDYRAGIVLRSLAAYERAHRRLLADLADVDGNLAADFIEESSSLRLYLPFLINRVRDIKQQQRPVLDHRWAQLQQAIHNRFFRDDESNSAS